MPFTDPIRPDDTTDVVRKIGRLATLLLELRTEYERRARNDLLLQIRERAAELNDLAALLPVEKEPGGFPSSSNEPHQG